MAIKVFIERSVSPENQGEVAELLKELRIKAIRQAGYVSGESLFSIDRPGTHMVISTWDNLRDWKAWEKSTIRISIVRKIETLLSSPSITSVYATTPRSIAEGV